MDEIKEDIIASKATIKRLPTYLAFLHELKTGGDENVSSTFIAEHFHLNPVQVRKDLALVSSSSGKPRLGFCISELIESIETFLGLRNIHDAVLIGAGHLGGTLLHYEGFRKYGLNIVAAFDISPEIVGSDINGVKVLPYTQMSATVKRLNIKMGIITVPKEEAQAVALDMADSGIRAIWNFAPVRLKLPQNVAVKSEDLAASLAVLSKRLEDRLRSDDED